MNKAKEKGVYTRLSRNGELSFRASFTFRRKHISLGSYSTEKEASDAYQTALSLIKNKTLTLDDYEQTFSYLPFEKWVSILNFRDNGIYIKTPIYLKKSFFFYYLSPDDVLKFDVEDLFYYSNHKILKRGGHLFLSDFGMQVSLNSRYGIKNFAVVGKDFLFLNGDIYDYRYSNIKIINPYYGVALEKEFPKKIYLSKININGTYIIGRYESEIEAALAYNKVVALLREAGFPKKYEENYIEESEDSSIPASKIHINKKILQFISSLKDSKNDLPNIH